jgi:hypothetical protein
MRFMNAERRGRNTLVFGDVRPAMKSFGALLAACLVVAACSSVVPNPSATSAETCDPSTGAYEVVGGGSPLPVPTHLACDAAIAAARTLVAGLPSMEHLVSIEFHYGRWCPPGARCGASVFGGFLDIGYVVFRAAAPYPDLRVSVSAHGSGQVTAEDVIGVELKPSPGT